MRAQRESRDTWLFPIKNDPPHPGCGGGEGGCRVTRNDASFVNVIVNYESSYSRRRPIASERLSPYRPPGLNGHRCRLPKSNPPVLFFYGPTITLPGTPAQWASAPPEEMAYCRSCYPWAGGRAGGRAGRLNLAAPDAFRAARRDCRLP